MSKNVSIVTDKGKRYVQVRESYRNAQGKPRSRIVERHGNLDKLTALDPQYVEKLKARVKRENEAEKEAKARALSDVAKQRIEHYQQIAAGSQSFAALRPLNVGIALLKRVWNKLELDSAFRYLQNKYAIKYSYSEVAFLLSALRLLNPGSKLDNFLNKDATIIPFTSLQDLNVLYRALDKLSTDKAYLVKHLNRAVDKLTARKISAIFYDVTTYAFESRDSDALRNFGLSKDHKVNEVQTVMGLLMDDNGIPLDHELFPGNTSEFKTLLPIVKRMVDTYHLDTVTVVCDRGLNSNENLLALEQLNCKFVIAQKVRSCTQEQQQDILRDDNWEQSLIVKDELIYKLKTKAMVKDVFASKISPRTGKRYPTSEKLGTLNVSWVITYSPKRARKDQSDILRAVTKAQKAITSGQANAKGGFRKYVKKPQALGAVTLDDAKVKADLKWAGFYAVCTNLNPDEPQQIMSIYRHLWQIEDCFRVSKTNLETRPCFVWTEEHIRGHFMSCYISLVMEKYLHYELNRKLGEKISASQIISELQDAQVCFDDIVPDFPVYRRAYTSTRFDRMLEAFDLKPIQEVEQKGTLRQKLKLKELNAPRRTGTSTRTNDNSDTTALKK